ncbi:hypothetical protein HRbin39_00776 [bacterium HR39]|nr:hypothetical protein HRbin39_00776 [bacterium HR39]
MKERLTREEIERRLAALREAHEALDEQVDRLESEGGADDLELKRLKKQTLAIKDRIAILERMLQSMPA